MMAWAKKIYEKLFPFSNPPPPPVFMFFLCLSLSRVGELEKALETLVYDSGSHSISRSPKLPLVFFLTR